MNILISNDDGIFAPGLKILGNALSQIEGVNIYACAPDRERSCIGHGLTLLTDLYLEEYPKEELGSAVRWAQSCSGTPADCVRMGLCVLEEQGIYIDLVCAGVNDGANTGSDINYSGTMAAAREAVLDGYPSIAFSNCKGKDYMDNFLKIVPEIMKRFDGKIPEKHILNVNAPNLPWSDIKGYKAAHLAHLCYPPKYTLMFDEDRDYQDEDEPKRRRYAFSSFSLDIMNPEEDADTVLNQNGYIAVSLIPLLQDTKATMPFVENLLK